MASYVARVRVDDNVIFNKISDISLSKSPWLLTFVIDLQPYEKFLDRLDLNIANASRLADKILEYYDRQQDGEKESYVNVFRGLKSQLSNIETLHTEISDGYFGYKQLHSRKRRSLLPFIGDLSSAVFGTVSEGDLRDIRENVATLASNQQHLSHVVSQSMTLVNLAQFEIKRNRQTINEIVESLDAIDRKIDVLTEELQSQITNLKQFVYMYSKLMLVLDEINSAIQRSLSFYTHLQIQLNSLSLQKLSPNLIDPIRLKHVLLQISTLFPKNIGLPADVNNDLWNYYKYITCSTLMDRSQILIVTEIPLIDYNQRFELYQAQALPSPFIGNATIKGADLIAYYKLENEFFAINNERTRYLFLNEQQANSCIGPFMHLCRIGKPPFLVNKQETCLISLFLGDKKKYRKHCETYTQRSQLPKVQFLADDVYLVMTKEVLKFYITCAVNSSKYEVTVLPPVGVIQLHKTCVASSTHFVVLGYYENKSSKLVETNSKILRSFKYNSKLWEDFNEKAVGNHSDIQIKLPKKLSGLVEMPMSSLISELKEMKKIKPTKTKFPLWGYFIIGLGLVLAYFIARCLINICCPGVCRICSSAKPISRTNVQKRFVTPIGLRTGEGSPSSDQTATDSMQMSALLRKEEDADMEAATTSGATFPSLMLAKK